MLNKKKKKGRQKIKKESGTDQTNVEAIPGSGKRMTRTEKRLDGHDQAGVDSGNTDDLVRDDSIHFDIKDRCGKKDIKAPNGAWTGRPKKKACYCSGSR